MRLQGPNPTCICAVIRASALCKPIRHDGGNEDKRITTEKEFREWVVDRDFTGEARVLRYTADGRMTGVSRGRRVEGTWSWVGDTLCRTATWGSRNLGYDCQAILVIGEFVVIVRDRGRGRAFALRSGPLEIACFC